ncbi:organomercurial lyase MerB [Kitasatospora albolonga]|uniref:organomercurial lyase n=1 Tax=Kitasatospora albolonga TaxID=68173 RepID=UPI0031E868C0
MSSSADRVQQLSDGLAAKWTSPRGVELMAAGATVVAGLLREGPLAVGRAGELLGWPGEEVLDRFRAMDFELETDPAGRVTGAGVSLDLRRPHLMELQGQRVAGWCAMDVLMFPLVLGEAASAVVSRCAATADPVSLTVTPTGLHTVSPAGTAVTLAPATGADIREVFCDRVSFYRSPAEADLAVARDPDLAACTAAEAWSVARRLADLF